MNPAQDTLMEIARYFVGLDPAKIRGLGRFHKIGELLYTAGYLDLGPDGRYQIPADTHEEER